MQKKSFTLVELMIVIAILAILSAIVIFALNPARLFDNFRDSKRVTDISSINKAIVFMESWNQSGITYGTTTNVYISLPDSNPSCTSYSLPTLPTGYSYYCSNATSYKNADGTGWIPINFTVEGSNRYLSNLPVDPVNNTSYFYTYYSGGSYELTAILSNPNKNSINDEGSLTSTFEIGSPNRTFVTPLQRDKGLVGYWKFNEGSGNYAYDSSGYGNTGTLYNNPTWSTLANGESCLNFDGTNDFVNCGRASVLSVQYITMVFWMNTPTYSYPNDRGILMNREDAYEVGPQTNNGYLDSAISPSWAWSGSSTVIPLNTWKMIAVTMDGYHKKHYINNSLIWDQDTTDGKIAYSGCPTKIGARQCTDSTASSYYAGYIDDVRLYNRALTQEEITLIYNKTKNRYE